MVGIKHAGASSECGMQCVDVLLHRDVEYSGAVASAEVCFGQQFDVALDAGNQCGFARFGQAQLNKRTDAVGIAVKNIKMSDSGCFLTIDSLLSEDSKGSG